MPNITASRMMAIRALNDQLRTRFTGGRITLTPGVMLLDDLPAILKRVREFNNFTKDNDPHGEHDFGAFQHNGQQIFWKIDYYDSDLRAGSPDPSDPSVTARVLVVLLAEEY